MFTKVRWQPTQPGYWRVRVPQGAEVLLKARFGGKDREPHSAASTAEQQLCLQTLRMTPYLREILSSRLPIHVRLRRLLV